MFHVGHPTSIFCLDLRYMSCWVRNKCHSSLFMLLLCVNDMWVVHTDCLWCTFLKWCTYINVGALWLLGARWLFVHVILSMPFYYLVQADCLCTNIVNTVLCTLAVGARNIVNARPCYGTYILCSLYCLLTSCFSLWDCCLIFSYFMLCLHSLLVLIYLLLHVYFGCCLTVFLWLIISYKSYPDLGINPSRVSVKFSRATLGFPSRYPSLLLGGLKGPVGSLHAATPGIRPY